MQELRSQLETERTDREEIEAELSPAKAKFCSSRHTFRQINTRCGYNSQPALSQTKKSKIDLADLEVILEIMESGSKKIITDRT